jgi:hypothetical protein
MDRAADTTTVFGASNSSENCLHRESNPENNGVHSEPLQPEGCISVRTKPKRIASVSLKQSYFIELKQIERALAHERIEAKRQRGLGLYRLKNRDASDFMNSDPDERLQFARESGLLPRERF